MLDHPVEGHGPAQGRRVLVVEDEMAIAMIIEDVLLDLGIEIVGPAARLDDALQLAGEERIDAAVLDINIPGGTTYAVGDILAQRGIPFVFSSGYADPSVEDRHRDRPRLVKPYRPQELEDSVLSLLGCG